MCSILDSSSNAGGAAGRRLPPVHALSMVAVAVLGLIFQASVAHAQSAYEVVSPPGVTSGFATGVSDDGSTAVVYLWPNSRSYLYSGGGLTDPGTLGGSYTYLYALSSNGAVAAGMSTAADGSSYAVRWTSASGLTNLGVLPGGHASAATLISADGSVLAGDSYAFTGNRAFRWTSASGMTDLGSLGGNESGVRALSGDGSAAAGWSQLASNDVRAFRWTQATGMQSLGTLGGNYSEAAAISRNGAVVAGSSVTSTGETHAFRWTAAGGMQDLGTLGGNQSYAYQISADGNAVAGNSVNATGEYHGFHWNVSTGMVDIGTLGGTYSIVNAMSSNGMVLVGQSSADDINASAFRWTQATGIQSIEAWLADSGVTVSSSFRPSTASGVSSDGSVVVGEAYDQATHENRPFIARGQGTSGGGAGLMDVIEYQQSLASSVVAVALPLRDADLVLHGAHGMPLQALLASGQSTVWAAGDVGAGDRSGQNLSQGAGEIGYSRGLSPDLQLKLAAGRTISNQGLHLAGNARHSGTYLLPELVWQMQPGLYASLSGYYNDGSLRVRRNYTNGGLTDSSTGEGDARTFALRARLDWLNLWKWNSVGLTPYASLTSSQTRVSAYTETGGSFPASWQARKEMENVARLGVDGVMTLPGDMKLMARAESAHRFEREAWGATGDVTGLFGFNLSTGGEPRNWLRLGLGVDLPLGPGRLSANLNATTRGGTPSYWIATSYRVNF